MTSKSIEATLAECEALISSNRHQKADDMLMEVINHGSPDDLKRLESVIREIISRFFKARQKKLTTAFNSQLNPSVTPTVAASATSNSTPRRVTHAAMAQYAAAVQHRLTQLSNFHIFQWSTYYLDDFKQIIKDTVNLIRGTSDHEEVLATLFRLTKSHSEEIFSKGYRNAVGVGSGNSFAAAGKALAGLRSFLEIPVEIYASEVSFMNSSADCRAIRRATSKVIAGIFKGFSTAQLGTTSTFDLLDRTIKSWAHLLPLVESSDLLTLHDAVGESPTYKKFSEPLALLARAVDLASHESSVDPVVIVSTFSNIELGFFDIALRAPIDSSDQKPLEIALVFSDQVAGKSLIEQKINHGFVACVTALPTRTYWAGKFPPQSVDEIVVSASDATDARFLLNRMRQRFHENKVVIKQGVPLQTNVAARFPLEKPRMLSFYRVSRESIRTLETMISTRTGVLLWCSIRRSGKTTGVTDLAKAIKEKSVVFQRCELTGDELESRVFFEEVCDKLASKTELPRDFVRSVIAKARPMGSGTERGAILILDEYDRLFGRLRAAGRRDEEVRHLVVQPLLDQLVEFATDNLVILLGQQPNAHYVFMDQNQLSAYVQQEPYPLFSHEIGTASGEFWELIGKILQSALRFDSSFVDTLYVETGGHPYLTVNLLREFVDWLIEQRAIPSETLLCEEFFQRFASLRLNGRSVARSKHFEFFRAAAAESLSTDGARETPWIHVAYVVLRHLGTHGIGPQLRCSKTSVEELVEKTLVNCELFSFNAESFVSSAAYGNFLAIDDDVIYAKVPLLARIASNSGLRQIGPQ
jgi:hypothetical protein